jgi:hypothetical protein
MKKRIIMKKTTPAIIATVITSTILSAGMLMVGLDATHTSILSVASPANNSSSAAQIQSAPAQSISTRSFFRTATLRTGGS